MLTQRRNYKCMQFYEQVLLKDYEPLKNLSKLRNKLKFKLYKSLYELNSAKNTSEVPHDQTALKFLK